VRDPRPRVVQHQPRSPTEGSSASAASGIRTAILKLRRLTIFLYPVYTLGGQMRTGWGSSTSPTFCGERTDQCQGILSQLASRCSAPSCGLRWARDRRWRRAVVVPFISDRCLDWDLCDDLLSIYLLNRFTDLEDAYNCPDQGFFFHRRTALVVIPIMLMIGSLALAWPHGWHCCSS